MLPLWDLQSNVSLLYQFLSPFFSLTFFSSSFRILSSFSAFFSYSCNSWMRKSLSGQQLFTKNSASSAVLQFLEFAVVSGAVPVISDTHVSELLGISCSTSTSETSSPLFFAFLGFFSGIILDRSNGFFAFLPQLSS